jgi:hypothetical protein
LTQTHIAVRGAREHNLKNISLDIPREKLVVITGLSGSGKSSLAFDTIYAEGQRRYVESLSAYARQFLEMMQKPDVDLIDGLSPAISIEQKTTSRNPCSGASSLADLDHLSGFDLFKFTLEAWNETNQVVQFIALSAQDSDGNRPPAESILPRDAAVAGNHHVEFALDCVEQRCIFEAAQAKIMRRYNIVTDDLMAKRGRNASIENNLHFAALSGSCGVCNLGKQRGSGKRKDSFRMLAAYVRKVIEKHVKRITSFDIFE